MKTLQIPSLDKVLDFRCPEAVAVFQREFNIPLCDAERLFVQMLKWLWIGMYHKADENKSKPKELAIFPPIIVLDEMWHCFILCTRAYREFCDVYFGQYIDHEPHVGPSDEKADRTLFKENIRYISDVMGDEVVTLWYGVYGILYSREPKLLQAET